MAAGIVCLLKIINVKQKERINPICFCRQQSGDFPFRLCLCEESCHLINGGQNLFFLF